METVSFGGIIKIYRISVFSISFISKIKMNREAGIVRVRASLLYVEQIGVCVTWEMEFEILNLYFHAFLMCGECQSSILLSREGIASLHLLYYYYIRHILLYLLYYYYIIRLDCFSHSSIEIIEIFLPAVFWRNSLFRHRRYINYCILLSLI